MGPIALAGCSASPTDAGEARYPPERVRSSCNTAGPTPPPVGQPFAHALEAPARVGAGASVRDTLIVRNTGPAVASLWTVLPEQHSTSWSAVATTGRCTTSWLSDTIDAECDRYRTEF